MEKHLDPSFLGRRYRNGDTVSHGGSSRSTSVGPAILALTALAGLTWRSFSSTFLQGDLDFIPMTEISEPPPFSWDQITPSEALEYHDCFDGFQCARLDVPMDYHRSDGQGSRMAIAVTRLPAKVPVTDPRYGGAIVINPGGPGGSGVTQALLSGHNLQTIADATASPSTSDRSADLYFDIIGFDPRGVNNTTPGFSCFPSLFSQRNWELQAEADGILGSSTDSLMRNWQRAVALNTGCSQALSTPSGSGEEALGEHINTPPVARDVLEIVERHGEWREKQGLDAQLSDDEMYGYDPQQPLVERTKWKRGQEKLQYWGRSYGTVLGATFAALFPDRIERMVLDGVVGADKYYTGAGPEPVADADAIFDKFAQYCHAIGEDCPFYASAGPAAIKESYKELEKSLLNSSIPVLPTKTRGPEVVTWTDLKNVLRIAIYQPLFAFSFLADIASDLAQGDGSRLADFKHGRRDPTCPTNECLNAGPWSSECRVPAENEMYASSAILCADAAYMQEVDEAGFEQHWRSLQGISDTVGDYWAHTHLNCIGWNVTPKWKMPIPVAGNTSHPLLFVNNILDPVTPLQSAKTMHVAFPGSGLLQQDSEGHCTLAAPSICVSQSIRKYFQTGELPASGTICDADLKPLIGAPNKIAGEKSPEDAILYEALLEEVQRPRIPAFPL
ncbi:TAP-like protein-domain-containing protein [Aspergillus karnatakaensis]|uniref:putative proteinase n=1 Tax=Aspergillus karnatakaensis TaxID=1810916 RepID=UPI003CCD790A